MNDSIEMVKFQEAAELLKITKRTLRRRVAEGRYTAYGDGSGRRLLRSSIEADIQRQQAKNNHAKN